MKNLLSLFNQKRACVPLLNVRGPHVRKYRAFRVFLEHNQTALSAIADLEQAYYSGRPLSLSWAAAHYEALWEAALGAVYALAPLKGKGAAELETSLMRIDHSITGELTPQYAARSNALVLPFERIKGEAVHITGAKAANLAKIANEFRLPVPAGFSVTTVATGRFLSANGLDDFIAKMLARASPDQPEAFERQSSKASAPLSSKQPYRPTLPGRSFRLIGNWRKEQGPASVSRCGAAQWARTRPPPLQASTRQC